MKASALDDLASLKKYLFRFKSSYALGFCSLFLTSIFTLLIPWILKKAIDSIKSGGSPAMLLRYAGLIIIFALIQGFFRFWMRNILIGISRKIEYLLRNDFFAHLQTLSLSFFQQRRTGDLMSLATNDLNAVRNLLGPGLMYFAHTLVLFPLGFGFMLATNWRLTLWIVISLPLVSLFIRELSHRLHVRFKAVQEQFSAINTQIQENFSGLRVIQSYGREKHMAQQFQETNDMYLQKNMNLIKISGLFRPLMAFFTGFFLLIILWVGGRQVISGQMSLGALAAFIGYLGLLLWPAVALGWVINLLQRGAVSMARINEVLQTRPEIRDQATSISGFLAQGKIEINHVDFAYPPQGPKVLQDINLRINPGESIGLVGRTGAGKSSLANLIPRLYEVSGGEIRINDVAINRIPLKILRKNIGYVPQESFIFSESIEHNIGFSLAEEDQEQIREAAFLAHLLEDIESFPKKFETMIGERGVTLSGGQKQRLAISRALVRHPPILILDDVFASVDLQTEHHILQKLGHIIHGRTCLIIAHRLSAVRDCDRIYVLEQGRIVESGTHEELMALDGFYSQTYQKQLLTQELAKEQ